MIDKNMLTRSKTRSAIKDSSTSTPFTVNIDFDYASEMWNNNKSKIGNGSYIYINCNGCKAYNKSGHSCKKKTPFDYCNLHYRISLSK